MHSMILITSINVFGRINDRIKPTATQNRANPITRFIAIHLFFFCTFYAYTVPFMRRDPVFSEKSRVLLSALALALVRHYRLTICRDFCLYTVLLCILCTALPAFRPPPAVPYISVSRISATSCSVISSSSPLVNRSTISGTKSRIFVIVS